MHPGSILQRAAIAMAVVFLAPPLGGTMARAAGIDEEYARRVKKLAPDDIAGHLELALWCKEQKAYELLRRECADILRLDPDHEQAKLLLALANKKLGKRGPAASSDDATSGPGDRPDAAKFSRVLTDEEIQILRRAELMCGQPERIKVKFKDDVLERFCAKMEARSFYAGREDRARFFRLRPAAKAQTILCAEPEIRALFAEDVIITSDPGRFVDFERNVMPVITRGCATAQCHGGPNGGAFRLFAGNNVTKPKTYTNFLLMHEYGKGKRKLINRDYPGESLLLTCGLKDPPPGLAHPVLIEPVFRSQRDPKYRTVRRWLESLDVFSPEYGIDLGAPP